jgi:hypothetical protein
MQEIPEFPRSPLKFWKIPVEIPVTDYFSCPLVINVAAQLDIFKCFWQFFDLYKRQNINNKEA